MSSTVMLLYIPPFCSKTSWIQIGYGVWVNFVIMGVGLINGFSGIIVGQLLSSNSLIKMTLVEESWIASVLFLTCPVGCIVNGMIVDKFGRRIALVICELPIMIGWFCTSASNTAKQIIIGRVITGFGMGMSMGGPRVYCSEISLPNVRGVLGGLPNVFQSIGFLLQAVLGYFYEWRILCYVSGGYALILMLVNCLLPETPSYLMKMGRDEKAMKSLKKLRSRDYHIEPEILEMVNLKRNCNIKNLSFLQEIKALFQPNACKPFCIAMSYHTLVQFSGISVVVTWSVEVLKNSRSSLNPFTGNVLLGVTRLFSSLLLTILLYKVRRRWLAIISGFGVGLSCLGVFFHVKYSDHDSYLPTICFVFYIMFASFGHYALPNLYTTELFPLQVRGMLSGITVALTNLVAFGVTWSYPKVVRWIGYANTILAFGILSFIGCIILYYILPETKDLTLSEIEEYFHKIRPRLISQRELMSVQMIDSQYKNIILSRSKRALEHNRSQSSYERKNPRHNRRRKSNATSQVSFNASASETSVTRDNQQTVTKEYKEQVDDSDPEAKPKPKP